MFVAKPPLVRRGVGGEGVAATALTPNPSLPRGEGEQDKSDTISGHVYEQTIFRAQVKQASGKLSGGTKPLKGLAGIVLRVWC